MSPSLFIVFLVGVSSPAFGSFLPSTSRISGGETLALKADADAQHQLETDPIHKLEKRIGVLERALTPTDLLGWTVFQRRMNGSVDFYRNWNEYVDGFGNPEGEFWMGLEKIGEMMKKRQYELRIDMQDFDGHWKHAYYENFHVGDKFDNFLLTVSGYRGNAGDGLARQNNMPFSTKDRDNDKSSQNCAQLYKGGWWYSNCHYSNLNGRYLRGNHDTYADGVNWYSFRGFHHSLKYTEMKMRRKP